MIFGEEAVLQLADLIRIRDSPMFNFLSNEDKRKIKNEIDNIWRDLYRIMMERP